MAPGPTGAILPLDPFVPDVDAFKDSFVVIGYNLTILKQLNYWSHHKRFAYAVKKPKGESPTITSGSKEPWTR